MMRIGVIAIQHESNTFVSRPATLDDFRADALMVGESIHDAYGRSRHEVGGFFEGLARVGYLAVPILLALATPGGVISAETFDALMKMLDDGLDQAGSLDGLLVAPHGAAVSQQHRDADGYWLSLVRQHVGQVPIVCTLDPHANVSDAMIRACDATVAYRTNPHLDQFETGLQAADILSRMLRGEIRPVQAIARPLVAISIDRQDTNVEPCLSLYRMADQMLHKPDVVSNSVLLGFPYADVHEMGSSFVVVCDSEQSLANTLAGEMASWVYQRREDYICGSLNVEDAIALAANKKGPVCLLDMGDNVGGGAPGDGTVLAHALRGSAIRHALLCIYDPEAAAQARQAGVGVRLRMRIGGKSDDMHGQPLDVKVMIERLCGGKFTEPVARHGGRTGYDMGPTAVMTTEDGLTIIAHSVRIPPFSLRQVTSCGIDPRAFDVIVAKGVNAPVAAYREVCSCFIRVNTPGVTTADMRRLDYQYRRRPIYPFESVDIKGKLAGEVVD